MNKSLSHLRRNIPSVDKILESNEVLPLITLSSRTFVLNLVRQVLNNIRQEFTDGIAKESTDSDIQALILEKLGEEFRHRIQPLLRRVINATGVLLHTNFGRAPLSHEAQKHLTEIAAHYSNLEFDLARGIRGKRDIYADRLLQQILGCEEAIVVNNNAAAVFLILNSLAENGEVLISRGELIEIGDSFRIPDILRKSAAVLREVGTTNKTKLLDYQEAINDRTKMILRVHPSNFRIVGFSSRPNLAELLRLCEASSIPLVEDLGSGCLVDLSPFGIEDEPNPKTSIEAGVAVICFSGDKLLGGPQSGVIAGKAEFVQKIRRNPLFRALRVDKLTLAALEATLLSYLKNRQALEIPLIQMIHLSAESIEKRAKAIMEKFSALDSKLACHMTDGFSMIGGGSTPNYGLHTKLISLRSLRLSASKIEYQLRMSELPILTRVEKDSVLIDLRTVFPEDDARVVEAVMKLSDSIQ
ncbi:MAG: L-seryl-tRNA(Sec) selenium transferase [Acidobacteria bacterium]|nr:MAG: L-seryl-tRNA(Sec) selenium transferase [Acidobacteriota bacterium]